MQERRSSLYATAYHLTGDRFEAEDLLQSALFSTYRAWDRITDKAAVGGYLRRTMTNLHISAWRRRKLNEYPTEELPETPGDMDVMRGTELRTVLWQALARLPNSSAPCWSCATTRAVRTRRSRTSSTSVSAR
ncbi:hypothetical protein STENM327S_00423 [Streptomyces tendae]